MGAGRSARRRQDTEVGYKMKPGRGDQSRQLLQQFHRRQQEMAGPIRPRRFEREGKMVGIENAQKPSRQGWPGHVAAQAFEPPPVRACDPRCRMQGKAARSKAQGRRTHPGGRELIEMGAVRAASTGSSSVSRSAAVSPCRPRVPRPLTPLTWLLRCYAVTAIFPFLRLERGEPP